MLQRLFSSQGMPEPKGKGARKRLVRLIGRLTRAGFRVVYQRGTYFA